MRKIGKPDVVKLLVLLASWLIYARQRSLGVASVHAMAAGAERKVEEAKRLAGEAPRSALFDCVLTAIGNEGTPLALSLQREVLGSSDGVVIGRSLAEARHVVADPSVSREHARVCVEDGVLYAEDLNSTNGSTLNGIALLPGKR